jgi:RNA polymerase sigma-70 factor (ECF subfamily)
MAGTPDQDAALMLRVKRGDREAFGELVERYQQPILSLAYRTLGDLAEAEDLTQQAFLQAWRSAHRYRDSARFSTWLYTIARNLCLNELRRRSRHPAQSLEAATAESEDRVPLQVQDHAPTGPTDVALQRELEHKIQEALLALPPNQRMAVLLCREEDLSYEDIARILGCSVSATKSLIHRGRETLKHRLKPYLRTGAWSQPTLEPEKL